MKLEDLEYFKAQQEHLKVLDHKEQEKLKLKQDKIAQEKNMRDQ